MRIKTKNAIQGYLFVVPIIILLLALSFYPLLRTIYLSFQNVKLATLNKMTFNGLKNYMTVLTRESPNFFKVIIPNTFVYVFGSIVGQIGLGFFLALIVNKRFLKLRGLFRSITILPWVVSGIIISISWRFMYEPRLGILNFFLAKIGMENLPTYLNDPQMVMLCLIIANIWHGMPFSFIIQTSGLQSIDENVYEAAVIDGATGFQQLAYITLPLLKPFLIMNLVMTSMNTINSFDLVYATTKGGPLFKSEVMAVHMYRRAFDFGKLGEGAAVAVIILLFNLFLTIAYMKLNNEKT